MDIHGFIERQNASGVSGWCVYADEDRRSEPVSLQLYVNDILLREAYTNRERHDIKRGYGVLEAGFLFTISPDLIRFLPRGSKLSVKTSEGATLPDLKPENMEPLGEAVDNGVELRKRLAEGWHIDQWGKFKISFGQDPGRKARYIQSMSMLCEFFMKRYGLPLFPAYGTLLGQLRDGRLIDHDDDVDTAYISRQNSIEGVSAEFWDIMRDLKALGHSVDIVATGQCNVSLKDSKLPGVDVFAGWISPDNTFYCYPRIGAPAPDKIIFEDIDIEGTAFSAPQPIEAFVEMMYGPNWKVPDPRYQSVVPVSVRKLMDALKLMSEDV